MSKNPRSLTEPMRLIVSVEKSTVKRVDQLMEQGENHQHRNRAEFVRQAIERELARCQQ